jgi:hypothetical protein
VESFERFAQNRSVIEEFATRWLSSYSTDLARLVYLATLRDIYTGNYHHPPLEEVYAGTAVHQSLSFCHEEMFTKFLENTFERQTQEVRSCLAGMALPAEEIAHRWLDLELFRSFLPAGAPSYLRDLFLSNIRRLLAIIVEERAQVSPII